MNTRTSSVSCITGGSTNVSGALCCDESSQSKKVQSAPEKMPPTEVAYAGLVGSGKGPMEGSMDLGQQSSVHGSLHPHAEYKKTTSHTYTETHAVSGYVGLPEFQSHPPHQQQQLMYYTNHGFRIRIPQGQHYNSHEGDEGCVLMKDGETFWMEIQNETDCGKYRNLHVH